METTPNQPWNQTCYWVFNDLIVIELELWLQPSSSSLEIRPTVKWAILNACRFVMTVLSVSYFYIIIIGNMLRSIQFVNIRAVDRLREGIGSACFRIKTVVLYDFIVKAWVSQWDRWHHFPSSPPLPPQLLSPGFLQFWISTNSYYTNYRPIVWLPF